VHLDADDHSFLALHTESGDEGPRKVVIVLRGRGFHPDWPEVAAPLRSELFEHGRETLSLQMPVLGKTAKYYDYVPVFPAGHPLSAQRIVPGADHLFRDMDDELVDAVAEWLATLGDDG